jgi:hypothetical protein
MVMLRLLSLLLLGPPLLLLLHVHDAHSGAVGHCRHHRQAPHLHLRHLVQQSGQPAVLLPQLPLARLTPAFTDSASTHLDLEVFTLMSATHDQLAIQGQNVTAHSSDLCESATTLHSSSMKPRNDCHE